jgi:transposase-like protein
MKYTIRDFRKEFGTEDKCLNYLFKEKYPTAKGYYRVSGRKCWANAKGEQIHPLADTIFKKSSTPLTTWFEAIFLFSISKNGVSAKELERHFGVTYKTAWRMAKQIRSLMSDDKDLLDGVVEADETYVGGYRKGGHGGKGKTPVLGVVQRGGAVRTKVVEARETHLVLNHLKENIRRGTHIYTDQFGTYAKAVKLGYQHDSINHWKKEFARGDVHTNTIEGFWSQLKRSLNGTYHSVSPKYLQSYVDEFAFRYSQRISPVPVFQTLVQRASR